MRTKIRAQGEMSELEKKIGYTFSDREILKEALSHTSFVNEAKDGGKSNERLEFLGDAVLSAIVSEYLFKRFPESNEGELSSMRRTIVERASLAEFSREIDLGGYLYLGHGESYNGGRDLDSNLEDAFEALTAAVYLDGGRGSAENFVMPFVIKAADGFTPTKTLTDPKSLLQEIIQESPGEKLEYTITGESGPDHDKTFFCEVKVNSNLLGKGSGKSKKEAEKSAAREALRLFGYDDGEKK